MGAVIFFKTEDVQRTTDFYTSILGFSSWLTQPNIEILKYDNLLLGIQLAESISPAPLLGLFVNSKEEVDRFYSRLNDLAENAPAINSVYDIYGFFAKDIDGRRIEVFTYLIETPDI